MIGEARKGRGRAIERVDIGRHRTLSHHSNHQLVTYTHSTRTSSVQVSCIPLQYSRTTCLRELDLRAQLTRSRLDSLRTHEDRPRQARGHRHRPPASVLYLLQLHQPLRHLQEQRDSLRGSTHSPRMLLLVPVQVPGPSGQVERGPVAVGRAERPWRASTRSAMRSTPSPRREATPTRNSASSGSPYCQLWSTSKHTETPLGCLVGPSCSPNSRTRQTPSSSSGSIR